MNSMGTERQQQRSKTSCTPWDQALFGRKLARSITPRVLRSTQQWKLNQVVAMLLQADLIFTVALIHLLDPRTWTTTPHSSRHRRCGGSIFMVPQMDDL